MATASSANKNMSDQIASALFHRFCKDTKLVREYLVDLHEDLGMTKTEIRKLKIREVVAELDTIIDKHLPKLEKKEDEQEEEDEEDTDEAEEVEEDTDEAEEVEEEEEVWQWFCHRKSLSLKECCAKCDRWYCQCDLGDEEPIRDGSITKCDACGMAKPGTTEEKKVKVTKEVKVAVPGKKVVTCKMGDVSHTVEKKAVTTVEDEEEDDESAEARVDEDGYYIPRADKWYYGEIPDDCTREKLVKIMAKALVKFQEDQKLWTDSADDFTTIAEILDLWFEHDSDRSDQFDHLICGDEVDDFTASVIAKASKINTRSSSE